MTMIISTLSELSAELIQHGCYKLPPIISEEEARKKYQDKVTWRFYEKGTICPNLLGVFQQDVIVIMGSADDGWVIEVNGCPEQEAGNIHGWRMLLYEYDFETEQVKQHTVLNLPFFPPLEQAFKLARSISNFTYAALEEFKEHV